VNLSEQNASVTPVKLPYENEVVDADQVGFTSSGGSAELLALDDGAKIEFLHKVSNVFRLRDKKKDDGSPIYICTGQVNINLTPAVSSADRSA